MRDTFDRLFCIGMANDALPAAAPCLRLRLPPRPPQPLYPLYPRSLVAEGAAAAWASEESLVWMLYGTSNSNSTIPLLISRQRVVICHPSAVARRESPPWDIELDTDAALLTEVEIECSFDDTDGDIAPALRAKRRQAWRCGISEGVDGLGALLHIGCQYW